MRRWAAFLIGMSAWAQPAGARLGIEIDGFGDGSRSRPFVDHARLFRPCTTAGGGAAPTDNDGWPTADAQCVVFDIRPIPAWAPPIDDPTQYQPDWSGVWQLSFQGRAEVSVPSGGATVEALSWDEAANTTSGRLNVQKGTGLVVLSFQNTRPGGFRALRLIRPGYANTPRQIYTDEFLRSFGPFRVLRYMDFTSTNDVTPSAAPADTLEWADRHIITDATQQGVGRKRGVAWEYAVLLANQTGTDMWINIPVAASEDYVRQLARLVVSRLNPALRIYIEHGNEVWNSLFANSYNYNRNAAAAEVAAGGSNLNNDNQPSSATDTFARRRHLRRVIEAVRIFRDEQRKAGLPDERAGDFDNWRVRGIFAWWTIRYTDYLATLNWGKATYGDLNQYLYGIATTHYYNISKGSGSESPERLLELMTSSSDNQAVSDDQFRQIAATFGLRHTIYEGGPDVGGGSTTNVANRILANRLPGMKDLVLRDLKANWFDHGGYEYCYFSHCGPCSRYGCWGAMEDIVNAATPKMDALREMAGAGTAPVVTSILNGASFAPKLAAGSFASLFGENLTRLTQEWGEGIVDGRALPTMLGGLQVRFNGKDAALSYASARQANVIVPPDLTPGDADVEVWTPGGVWKGKAVIQSTAPAWFGYTWNGRFYPSAVFAGTRTIVGTLPGISSRAARAGDVIECYAAGLGPTAAAIPANEAPDRAYPLADASSIRVSIGGKAAEVLFAGVTLAGVYQVNVRVPAGLGAGDQTVTLEAGPERAPDAWLTMAGEAAGRARSQSSTARASEGIAPIGPVTRSR